MPADRKQYIRINWTNNKTKLNETNLNAMDESIKVNNDLAIECANYIDEIFAALIEQLSISYDTETSLFNISIGTKDGDNPTLRFNVSKSTTIPVINEGMEKLIKELNDGTFQVARAYSDEDGNNIKNTYASDLSLETSFDTSNGSFVLTLNNKNGTALASKTFTLNEATTLQAGLMSANDKIISNKSLTNSSFVSSGDSAELQFTKGDGTKESVVLPQANNINSGLMSPSDKQNLIQLQNEVANLKNQTVRLLYSEKENPTSEEILSFVESKGYTDKTKYGGIAVVIEGTNHIWKWTDESKLNVSTTTDFSFNDNIINEPFTGGYFYETFNFKAAYDYLGTDHINVEKIIFRFYETSGAKVISYIGTDRQGGNEKTLVAYDKLNGGWQVSKYLVLSAGYQGLDKDLLSWLLNNTNIDSNSNISYEFGYFKDFGLDTVANFTNETAGVIKGGNSDGQIHANANGTGFVSGWDKLINNFAPLYDGSIGYLAGDFVTNRSLLYRAKEDIPAPAMNFDDTKWEQMQVSKGLASKIDYNGNNPSLEGVSIGGVDYKLIPYKVTGSDKSSIGIGANASPRDTAQHCVVIQGGTWQHNGVAIGYGSYTRGIGGIAIGYGTKSNAEGAITLGHGANNDVAYSLSIGDRTYLATDWTKIKNTTDDETLADKFKSEEDNIAPAYSNEATYTVGSYVMQNGKLQRNTTPIDTPEEFDATKWEEVSLSDAIPTNYFPIVDSPNTTATINTSIQVTEDQYNAIKNGCVINGKLWGFTNPILTAAGGYYAGLIFGNLTNANGTSNVIIGKYSLNPWTKILKFEQRIIDVVSNAGVSTTYINGTSVARYMLKPTQDTDGNDINTTDTYNLKIAGGNVVADTQQYVRKIPAPASTTLTDEELEAFKQGVFIEGDFLNHHNPFFTPASLWDDTTYFGAFIGPVSGGSATTVIRYYSINKTTKEIYQSTGKFLSINNVGVLNDKAFPIYPSDTTKDYFLKQAEGGTLEWDSQSYVKKMKAEDFNNLSVADKLQTVSSGVFIEGTLLGLTNPILFPASVSSGNYRYGTIIGTSSVYGYIKTYELNIENGAMVITSNFKSLELDVNNIKTKQINSKPFPAYPTDTTKNYSLKLVSGNLTWVEDTEPTTATDTDIDALFN